MRRSFTQLPYVTISFELYLVFFVYRLYFVNEVATGDGRSITAQSDDGGRNRGVGVGVYVTGWTR